MVNKIFLEKDKIGVLTTHLDSATHSQYLLEIKNVRKIRMQKK